MTEFRNDWSDGLVDAAAILRKLAETNHSVKNEVLDALGLFDDDFEKTVAAVERAARVATER